MTPLVRRAVPLAAILAGVGVLVTAADPARPNVPTATVYDKDPGHLWNRIHATLLIRTGPDGKHYGEDRIEPLLWKESRYLLNGEQADRAVAALEEFLRDNGERLFADPMKRAVLQRDLWLVASWLIGREDREGEKLLGLLARAIRRLALTGDQIAKLPDNYAAAVASKTFAAAFDPKKPARAYLPPDLFDPAGPWVSVGRTDGRTAPAHLGASHSITPNGDKNPFTNSTFLVFVRLPANREAGLAFVKELARQKRPTFPVRWEVDGRATSFPNRDLPALPVGSELAFVRRALLIDTAGRGTPSPLTESVQLRPTTDAVVPPSDGGGLAEDPKRAAALEFELRRADLFGPTAVGLRDVSAEPDFVTGFRAAPFDEFEVDRRFQPGRPALLPFAAPTVSRRESCFGCHAVSSVYGTRSFQRPWTYDEVLTDKSPPLFPVAVTDVRTVEKVAVQWKEAHPGWVALRKHLAE